MRSLNILSSLVAVTLFASSALADMDPIVIKGAKFFFKSNGTQFFMRGVAYQRMFAQFYITPIDTSNTIQSKPALMVQLALAQSAAQALPLTKIHLQTRQDVG